MARVTLSLEVAMGRTIRLKAVRHEAPTCEDYGDLGTVLDFERAMRVHRAHAEAFEITSSDGRADGAWLVRGASGSAYVVDIVDGSGLRDACTCLDFLGGGLGVCKHLEVVRRAFLARRDVDVAHRRLPSEPKIPTLTVDVRDGLSLVTAGPWTRGHLSALGLRRVKGRGLMPRPGRDLRPGHMRIPDGSEIRVVHAALPVLDRLAGKTLLESRRAEFQRAMGEGRGGVDVLKRPLFAYQEDGVRHLVGNGRALLADDMGLGKTVQAIAACEVLRRRGEARSIVIVAPASLKDQWAREIERYAGAKAAILGSGLEARTAALNSDAPYKILNYELTWRELSRLQELDADVLILDEAQRAKNFRTKTATTLRAIPSRFLFVLTGTPVENRLDDLYALLQLVNPDILGPLWRFNFDFHRQGPKGKVLGCKNLARLRDRLAPVVLRRRKEEVLDQLPDMTEQTRYTLLTKEQKELEEGHRATAAQLMAKAERRPLSPAEQKQLQGALLKARQACDALELCDPSRKKSASPKLDEFEALVSEVASEGTAKLLVFSEWVEMLKLAAARLDRLGIGWAMLSGEVPTDRRPALLERFRNEPEIQVLLCSDAGGSGLNLQTASYVVHLDLPWNPARLDQRNARAHRLGQTRGVSVTYLCAAEGIERGIEGTLGGKRAVRSAALDPGSDVEEVEHQSFSMFLRQLQEAMEELEGSEIVDIEGTPSAPPSLLLDPDESVVVQAMPVEITSQAQPSGLAEVSPSRAASRLRLARVVLEAGFPGDAVKAAYEALASALASRLDAPPVGDHAALVAAMYRDLVPAGRLPLAAPGALARLHDLTFLEAHGVDVDPTLALEAVREAEDWILRLQPEP
jgi:superfamily II DNA or RNA helicase